MQTKKLEHWQKFRLDRDAVEAVRAMLNLREEDELPEALWVIMGIHKAMEQRFIAHVWGYREIATMIIETQFMLPTLKNLTKYVPGELVRITTVNREGHYWHAAPLGMHLINCYGDLFMVTTQELDAPDQAIRDSELNRLAAAGKRVPSSSNKGVKPAVDPTLPPPTLPEEIEAAIKAKELASAGT